MSPEQVREATRISEAWNPISEGTPKIRHPIVWLPIGDSHGGVSINFILIGSSRGPKMTSDIFETPTLWKIWSSLQLPGQILQGYTALIVVEIFRPYHTALSDPSFVISYKFNGGLTTMGCIASDPTSRIFPQWQKPHLVPALIGLIGIAPQQVQTFIKYILSPPSATLNKYADFFPEVANLEFTDNPSNLSNTGILIGANDDGAVADGRPAQSIDFWIRAGFQCRQMRRWVFLAIPF